MGDFIVLAVLGVIVGMAIARVRKEKKQGGCCGNCSGCAGCCRNQKNA